MQIFNTYTELSKSIVSTLVEALADEDGEHEEESAKEKMEKELEEKVEAFEALMNRHPFLVNDVPMRRSPHYMQEWEKRVVLWGADDKRVAEKSRRATANLQRLYTNFVRLYEDREAAGLRAGRSYDEAICMMQRASAVSHDIKVLYHDHALPAQARLLKSLKLWSSHVDLIGLLGTVDYVKAVYDRILKLCIANT